MREMELGGRVTIGGDRRPVIIAGPCVIESEEHCLTMARALRDLAMGAGLLLVFKASFDKANRSSIRSYRGPGMEAGLRILSEVKRQTGLPVLSDIHEPSQAAPAAKVLDVLQIPAFLCRQTDLLLAAAATGAPINVKKGQFLSPWETGNVVEKIRSAGNARVLLTERGTSFGYQNLVVDFRSIPIMQGFQCPVIFDASHSVQLPGQRGEASGGDRAFIPALARAGIAAGADGLFVEVHDQPERALSDGPNALPLSEFPGLLAEIRGISEALGRTR